MHKDSILQYDNYEEYVKAQNAGFQRKVDSHSGVGRETILEIKKRIPTATNILCHGTRAGYEQKFFASEYEGAEVIGTEIADGCEKFDMTVQWDMHKPKEEWLGKFDIIYTNVFDHAIYPEKALNTWYGQLASGGSLIMEFHGGFKRTAYRSHTNTKTDPNLNYCYEDVDDFLTKRLGSERVEVWRSPSFEPDPSIHDDKIRGGYGGGRRTVQHRKP